MKTILITGFEPFDHDLVNPSWQAVSALPDEINGVCLIKKEIPVVFDQAPGQIKELMDQYDPDLVICTGYNAKARELNLEYAALNLKHARIADNAGNQPQQQPIAIDGPLALESRLPVFELEKMLNQKKISAKVSFSAGTYVCNDVMYEVVKACQEREIPGGFIHIPPFSQEPKSGMPFENVRAGLVKVVEFLTAS